ncbi:hypothetical protein BDZ45DRAFT_739589 [Acephala macrosclerotiorum]|nr:hypothetical protein BDZ45DRAFT_739589 [Acephala macrosclerotiorum]
MNLEPADDRQRGLENSKNNIIIPLLLSNFCNLQSLDFRLRSHTAPLPPVLGEKILQVLTSRAEQKSMPWFPHLQDISLSLDRYKEYGYCDCDSYDMEYILDFEQEVTHLFDLPGLGTLLTCCVGPWRQFGQTNEDPRRSQRSYSQKCYLDIPIALYLMLDDELWDVFRTVGSTRDFKLLKYVDIPISFLADTHPHGCSDGVLPGQVEP